jgi:hypothetical protein
MYIAGRRKCCSTHLTFGSVNVSEQAIRRHSDPAKDDRVDIAGFHNQCGAGAARRSSRSRVATASAATPLSATIARIRFSVAAAFEVTNIR